MFGVDRQRVRQLAGETIRELGVLAMVFVPLDAVVASASIQRTVVAAALVFGFACVIGGIILEARE